MNPLLPPLRQGPSVWYGSEIQKEPERWIIHLTETELRELDDACRIFLASGKSLAELDHESFPLPTLMHRLQHEIRNDRLLRGMGFVLIKGLPADKYAKHDLEVLFFGLGSYIGRPRAQNARGDILGHVCDLHVNGDDPYVRLYQTNERQTFHTDSCDVVGLLCVQPARRGGESLLVSSDTVYNEMRRRWPHLLPSLLGPIATDRRGEVPPGMLPYVLIPVLNYHEGLITPFYQRQYIESAQRFSDAPRLTAEHTEALDAFDCLCNDPTMHLKMVLERGDMLFVYNHSMLHDRTAFVDAVPTAGNVPDEEENERGRRHLFRLWLSVPGDRPLPSIFASRYGSVEIGNRGGVTMLRGSYCAEP
jgi:hypothetical protein